MQGCKPYELYNESLEDAPAWAIAEIVRYDTENNYIIVKKPSADSLAEVMIISGGGLRSLSRGTGFSPLDGSGLIIRYDDADGAPATGDDYGTTTGSWMLKKNKLGFTAWASVGTFPVPQCGLFQAKVCNE